MRGVQNCNVVGLLQFNFKKHLHVCGIRTTLESLDNTTTEEIKMNTLSKVTCARCSGTGKFSFHSTKGTVCFGCNGSKFQMIDMKKEAAKKNAAEKRKAEKVAKAEIVRAATYAVMAEMNVEFDNKFDIETCKGMHDLDMAVAEKYGKSIYAIRDERLNSDK
jgi:hypothetical protein